jgi:hypothetical protein
MVYEIWHSVHPSSSDNRLDKALPGGHCERFLRSNTLNQEIATPQGEHLRAARRALAGRNDNNLLGLSDILSTLSLS